MNRYIICIFGFLLLTPINGSRLEIVKTLIEHGADVNAQDNFGWTPLFSTIIGGGEEKYEIAKLLIEKGANVNIEGNEGENPLYLAILVNDVKMVKILVEAGADIHHEYKKTPNLSKVFASLLKEDIEIPKKEKNNIDHIGTEIYN